MFQASGAIDAVADHYSGMTMMVTKQRGVRAWGPKLTIVIHSDRLKTHIHPWLPILAPITMIHHQVGPEPP